MMNQSNENAFESNQKEEESKLTPNLLAAREAAWNRLQLELNFRKQEKQKAVLPRKMPGNWLQRLLSRIIPI